MNTTRALIWAVGLLLIVGLASIGSAADKAEEGFTPLFNGKDLSGWIYGKKGDGGENKAGKGYQVENGVLFCTAGDGGNLYTEKEYSDFIFRFEFRLSPSANNGLGIRAPLSGDSAYAGMELQILDNEAPVYKDKLRPTQYHGSVYDVFPAKRGFLKPTGQWNQQEVAARGRWITVTLNGEVIVDVNLDNAKDPAVLAKHPGLANQKGHIGFLGHGARVEFKNIRIKDLTDGK